METPTHTTPVALARLVLHLHEGQAVAECPHCKGELSKKTPIMKGDEPEEIRRNRSAIIVGMWMATDPRFKCPHCYGRFELVIHLQNDQVEAARTLRQCADEIHSLENAELCQPCPPSTPPRQETAAGQGLA